MIIGKAEAEMMRHFSSLLKFVTTLVGTELLRTVFVLRTNRDCSTYAPQ